MRNILTWAAVIGVAVGMKFMNKSSDAEDIRAFVDEMCIEDASCLQTVEANFDQCFEASYTMGGRRTSASLDVDTLMGCITADSEDFFAFEDGDSYE